MKISLILLAASLATFGHAQSTAYVAVKADPAGSSEKADLELFHLNHILYSHAFIISDIYPSISAKDMSVITDAVHVNLGLGKRTHFMIKTDQKVPYRITVTIFKNKQSKETGLIILTNFNPKNGKFEKKPKENHYANWCPLVDNVVTGSIFAVPMEDEEKCREKNDYISLINMHLFNTICDTSEINAWFALAEEKQPDMINNRNFLKSYYYLATYNFSESEIWLEETKKSVATFSIEEQNGWRKPISVLSAEIETLKEMKGE